MTSRTENNNLEMELLDLQKKFDEEKRAHGETIQQLLTAQAQAQKAQAQVKKLEARMAQNQNPKSQETFKLLRLPLVALRHALKVMPASDLKLLSAQAQAQVAQAQFKKLNAQMTLMRVVVEPQAQTRKPKAQDTFKLLHLPSVALRHLFRVMPASELLLLSMSSRQVRIAARSIHRVAFVHVESVPNGSLLLSLEYLNGQKAPILSLDASALFFRPTKSWKIGGQNVGIRFAVTSVSNPPEIQCIESQKQSVWTEIETTIAELWGPRPLSLCLAPAELRTFPQTQREIAQLIVPRLSEDSFNAEIFDMFFDRQVVETRVARIDCKVTKYLRLDSKLLNVNEVGIWSSWHFMAPHLMNFTGRHLSLHGPSMAAGEIVQFIGSWLRGQTHENLETLYISTRDFWSDYVWACFKEEWLTRDNEPKQYVTTSEYSIDKDGSKGYYDCSDARDLRRITDGRLASVKCTNQRFFFFVWPQKPVITV